MYERIVVGTDGSATSGTAVDAAIELAALTGATLHVVYAWRGVSAYHLAAASDVMVVPVDTAQTTSDLHEEAMRICTRVADAAGRVGVKTETHCIPGDAADVLISVAQDTDADLIVVGNRGMGGVRRVLGSVPNKVSHHCPTSLLIVDTSGAAT